MSKPLTIIVSAVGWAGHVFPALALGRELDRRGHAVTVQTFERWRGVVEGLGLRFVAARELMRFAGIEEGHGGPTLAEAAIEMQPLLADSRPAVVVSDLFTLVPALAAEAAGVRRATLIPHPYPVHEPGLPLYPLGLLPPRTAVGALAWRAAGPIVGPRLPNTRLRQVRKALDRTRAELGLGPVARYDGQISDQLALVATFPQLEYPRRWPANVHVSGPMPFELPHADVELPPGEEPLVLVASSTERDPDMSLVRISLEALADEPVRVIASINRRGEAFTGPVPTNARVVDWLSYSQVISRSALVICHGGHGTIVRALGAGTPVLVVPPAGDMAENGARVAWSGAGLMLPGRMLSTKGVRVAARSLLREPRFRARAGALAAWGRHHDGTAAAAVLVERLAR